MEAGFVAVDDGFDLYFAGRIILRHRPDAPALATARGDAQFATSKGHFAIADRPADTRIADTCSVAENAVTLYWETVPLASLRLDHGALEITALCPGHDRLTVRFAAEPDEAVWGAGEQFSYLALNGRRFPIWTSEPGVGRDPAVPLATLLGEGGGDYWHSNFPQPTFLTSRWLAVHLDATVYSVLDFTDPAKHAVEVWAN